MNTLKKASLGLFIAMFGFFTTAMTAQDTNPEMEYHQVKDAVAITLTGKVIDGKTKDALEGVEVEITKISETAETNEKGKFMVEGLEAGKTYTLKVDQKGYETYEKTVKTDQTQSPAINVVVKLTPAEE